VKEYETLSQALDQLAAGSRIAGNVGAVSARIARALAEGYLSGVMFLADRLAEVGELSAEELAAIRKRALKLGGSSGFPDRKERRAKR
jgi:hypothetical protein